MKKVLLYITLSLVIFIPTSFNVLANEKEEYNCYYDENNIFVCEIIEDDDIALCNGNKGQF